MTYESTEPRAGVHACVQVVSCVIFDLLVSDPGAATAENAGGGNGADGPTGARAKVATNTCFYFSSVGLALWLAKDVHVQGCSCGDFCLRRDPSSQ